MTLSLYHEYLLGYLAAARAMPLRTATQFALAGSPEGPQAKALLAALALGIADARRQRTIREAHEIRIHVMSLLSRSGQGSKAGAMFTIGGAAEGAIELVESLAHEALEIG